MTWTQPTLPYGKSQPGETNPASKLTADTIRHIRQWHADGASLREIADDYGVSHQCIHQIVHRKTWKHIA
jgi:IS30 family transposase